MAGTERKKKFGDRFDVVAPNGEECSLFTEDNSTPFDYYEGEEAIKELENRNKDKPMTEVLVVYSSSPL